MSFMGDRPLRMAIFNIAFLGAMVIGCRVPLHAAPSIPTLEEVVYKLTHVNESLQTFQVEQDVEARWLFFRFRMQSTVYAARPAKYKVVVHDPPYLLRRFGSVFVQVGRPEDVLVHYTPRMMAWKDDRGRQLLYLGLVKLQAEVNPPTLEAFIDPARWLVERLLLHYDWGDVIADYQYTGVGGFTLPITVSVSMPNYPIAVTLAFRDYQLNVPLPDSLFETK